MTEASNGQGGENVYEMLWDCKHCGTKKLLGLSHRHCPECGAPQNADERYFPSDDEKIAVKDHVYYGKDVVCRYCNAYNSRSSRHCRECGSPASEGGDAKIQADQVHDEGTFKGHTAPGRAELAAAPPKKKSRGALFAALGAVGAVVAVLALFLLWKKDASFEVTGQAWQRQIDIERFGPVTESNWCDGLPAGAKVTRKYSAVRSHEKVASGEDCKTRKIDQGDGTFVEKQECKPRYESKPVEDDKCDYTVDKWARESTATAEGTGMVPQPVWPEVNTGPACTRVGCRRAGARRERYVVTLRSSDGAAEECDVEPEQWSTWGVGKRLQAQVRVLSGGVDCSSLAAR